MVRSLVSRDALGKLGALLVVACSVVGCGRGASPEEQAAAQAALERWQTVRPSEYTFTIVPDGVHSNVPARIRVKDDGVIENMDHTGRPAGYDSFTMTAALQEAIETASHEELFAGSYDPEYGYLIWYDVPPADRNREGPSTGLDVTCFDPSIKADACALYFRTDPPAAP